MKYLYYPGCSLEGTAIEYNKSTQALMKLFGVDLLELEGWNCCGASAAESVSYLLSMVLPARNLAIAEKAVKNMDIKNEILVPCSACYLNLKKVEVKIRNQPELLKKINTVLNEEGLHLEGNIKVRHLLDVIITDFGPEAVLPRVKRKFKDFLIAPYYGCQCLRPYIIFDDPEAPRSMEPLIEAVGAKVFDWDMGGKCCGASLMNTKKEVGMELTTAILKQAKGADAIITVCPMCQMNLDAYQNNISKRCDEDIRISVLYLPQLLGLAMGLSKKQVGLDLNLTVTQSFKSTLDPLC